ncbi:MAG: hypothetical protein ACLFTI_06685 [Anaerolineales bacterium]
MEWWLFDVRDTRTKNALLTQHSAAPVDASAPGFGKITVEVGVWVVAE